MTEIEWQIGDDYDAFARFYDLFYQDRYDDLAMYRDFAQAAGGSILELGCGTGRVLVPLARDGHHITGLDTSAALLAVAREKVKTAGLEEHATLVEDDMREFDLPTRFGLALLPINTFMHCYDTQEQLACLGCIRRHLEPGGRLIVDVYHPDPQALLEADGRLMTDTVTVDPQTGHTIQHCYTRRLDRANQIQNLTFIMDEMDESGVLHRHLFPFQMRFVYRYEMELLLRAAGFGLETVYGSYDLEPFESSSDKMIFVARNDWG